MSHPLPMSNAPSWLAEMLAGASDVGEDTDRAIAVARRWGRCLPAPGGGATLERWGALAELARVGVTVARVVEAHTDALAILAESGTEASADVAYGVFAAESPGHRLDAGAGGSLTGSKPWCSLGGSLDAALVTAHVGDRRQLFLVDLRHPTVHADPPSGWVARGLRTVTSGPVHFARTPAVAVGEPQWYLNRPGFAWGGIGVAACWHGGATGLADTLLAAAAKRTGELTGLHVGVVDAALHASATALEHAARRVDAGADAVEDPARLALRTRAVVAASVEKVLEQVNHALGPAPLAFDAAHAARVADLMIYVRQHHGERDLAALGRTLLAGHAE